MEKQQESKEEGPRSFSRFLHTLADGEAESTLSYQLHELMKRCQEEAITRVGMVKGALSLKLRFAIDEHGHAEIAYDVAIKEPARKTSKGHFWLTKHGNLTAENPKQTKLPLRDVGGREPARQVIDEPPGAAREV